MIEAIVRKLKIKWHNQQASSSKVQKYLPVCFGNWSPRAIKFNRSIKFAMEDVKPPGWKNYINSGKAWVE